MTNSESRLSGLTIRARRLESGMSLSQLAEAAGVSKSYLWNLENEPEHKKPSAETLYALAEALGTTMSDLLGRRLLSEPSQEIDETLQLYADQEGLSQQEVQQLASIRWRGDPPKTIRRWRFVHESLMASRGLDD